MDDVEIKSTLQNALHKRDGDYNVEKIVEITYQPQAAFKLDFIIEFKKYQAFNIFFGTQKEYVPLPDVLARSKDTTKQ